MPQDEKDLLQQNQGPSNQQQMEGLLQNTQQQLGVNIPGQHMGNMVNNSLQSVGNNLNPTNLASTALTCVGMTAQNIANGMNNSTPGGMNNPVPGAGQLTNAANDVAQNTLSPLNINQGPQPGGGGGKKDDKDNPFQQANNTINKVGNDPNLKQGVMMAVAPELAVTQGLTNQSSGPGQSSMDKILNPQPKPPGS